MIAGCGPDEALLRQQMPQARFMGWVDRMTLAGLYKTLDLFVFPSKFDTFGNVILEAFVNGMPVVAYDTKGPRDIVQDNVNGFLVDTKQQMSAQIIAYFHSSHRHSMMKTNALKRAEQYQAEPIMDQFLADLGLAGEQPMSDTQLGGSEAANMGPALDDTLNIEIAL